MTNTYNIPNISAGADELLIGTASTLNIFIPSVLIFVFLFIFIGGITREKFRGGTADFPMWATISSLATLVFALPMTFADGLINSTILGVIITINFASGVWLFMDRNRNEI